MMEQEVARRPSSAPPLHVLDHGGCEDLLGMTVSRRVLGGRWLPSGGTIHPIRFLYGLVAAAQRRGAQFFSERPAVKLHRRGTYLQVDYRGGSIQCESTVVACNSKSAELLPPLAGLLAPARGQVLSTQPMKPIFRFGMAIDWGTVYWRQTSDGALVLGGYRGRDLAAECTAVEEPNRVIQQALTEFLPQAFPEVPPIQVERQWAGIMDQTEDDRPIVGQWPPGEDTWIIAGFGGHGLPPALGYSKVLAEGIMCGANPPALDLVNPSRLLQTRQSNQVTS
jgi:glycine/D-amino acid oxidase-like deaminating enzyme